MLKYMRTFRAHVSMTINTEYRGKTTKGSKWVYGSFVFSAEWYKGAIYQNELVGAFYQLVKYDVDPDTAGQYSGIPDKKGAKIYQGDVVLVFENDGKYYKRLVIFDDENACFCFRCTDALFARQFADEYLVVGNIYDNPELIGEL